MSRWQFCRRMNLRKHLRRCQPEHPLAAPHNCNWNLSFVRIRNLKLSVFLSGQTNRRIFLCSCLAAAKVVGGGDDLEVALANITTNSRKTTAAMRGDGSFIHRIQYTTNA